MAAKWQVVRYRRPLTSQAPVPAGRHGDGVKDRMAYLSYGKWTPLLLIPLFLSHDRNPVVAMVRLWLLLHEACCP